MSSLDLFFEYSFDPMANVGPDGYFKRVNPALERALGYNKEELYAQPVVSFLHPDDVGRTKKRIEILASGTTTVASINRYRCKDGTYKTFSWNTTSAKDIFYSVGRDITEQIKTEEQIRELNQQLAKKNEDLEKTVQARMAELQQSEAQVQQLQKMDAIGRLAGGIAHDFNNMLGAISLYCDTIEEEPLPPSTQKYVQNIRRVTDRAAALTRQLLIFSRKQIFQFKPVNLNPVIQQLEAMLVRLIGENIKFVSKLQSDLHMTSVDPSQIEQVILNLVVNARDALPVGGTITVETSNIQLDEVFTSTHLSVNPGHYVLLSVSDTGTGMSADTVAKIFEPFFTTKGVGKGTGLGLSTTYGIVKQSKGTIWVYSEIGRGTVFKIYLPVVENTVPVTDAVQAKPTANRTGTLLLVEDDVTLREGFSGVLKKKGYQVLVAADANEALEFLKRQSQSIDLLITDVVMPGITGVELAQKAQALSASLRVLYMSGYTSDALDKSGKEEFRDSEFIQKPFNTSALISKVNEVLSR